MNRSATDLKVGGLTRLSTCDWPGELAATMFCQGCAWDCAYCHNPGLRPAHGENPIAWPAVVSFLKGRRGLLDAVVFSGGEPLLQPAIAEAVAEVRALGFRIGLHTTGMIPERFLALLPQLDWVGFDVKAPFASYVRISGAEGSGEKALASLQALLASGVAYEVRTTCHSAWLSTDDLLEMKKQLLGMGVRHFVLQQFRAQGVRASRQPAGPSQLAVPDGFGQGFDRFQVR